ncbi:hypothetical protein GUJ93_ZPchr0012g19891 [Zizania palustris]|uniref:Serine-threonine/tyrosine-protein kinase catalytic domain-containing protein n=1 Tax=Zizania palustris TaxID=103762 RepID=A0A8J5WQB8_ZIZPA|nr:hypothetical protein GUJ93_ZPchr0012g19891 [Zizania palustris]
MEYLHEFYRLARYAPEEVRTDALRQAKFLRGLKDELSIQLVATDYADFQRLDLRPEIPRFCPSAMASIMQRCWDADPDVRPEMDEVVRLLEALDTSKGGGMAPEVKPAGAAGCFSFFRRRPHGT